MHAAMAFVWAFMVVMPISFAEAALAFPGICWLYRMVHLRESFASAARWAFLQPAFIAGLAWFAWRALAITWSPMDHPTWTQFRIIRWGTALFVIYPMLRFRGVAIAGMALGFLAGNVTQAINWIGVKHDVAWLVIKPFTDRNGGWWPVTYGAQHLVAALGLHLPVAMMGRGKWRLVGIAGTLVTIAGLLATGARGSWIAAVLLGIVVLVVAIVRERDARKRTRLAAGSLACAVALGGIAWVSVGPLIKARFAQARDEITRAIEHRDFSKADGSRVGDDSARVAMLVWAVEAIKEHPILGTGTGGYYDYVKQNKQADGAVYEDVVKRGHGHCHNALLHEWATTGLIGLLITLGATFVALWSAFASQTRESLGTYAAGPAFALVGYLMLWPFDAIEANATTAKVLFALIALCPAWYPGAPRAVASTEARAQAQASEASG